MSIYILHLQATSPGAPMIKRRAANFPLGHDFKLATSCNWIDIPMSTQRGGLKLEDSRAWAELHLHLEAGVTADGPWPCGCSEDLRSRLGEESGQEWSP